MVTITFAVVNTLSLVLYGDYQQADELPKQENDVDEEKALLEGHKPSPYCEDGVQSNFQQRILEERDYDRVERTLSTSYSSYLDHCIIFTESLRSGHPEGTPLLETPSNKMKNNSEDSNAPSLMDAIKSPQFHQIGMVYSQKPRFVIMPTLSLLVVVTRTSGSDDKFVMMTEIQE